MLRDVDTDVLVSPETRGAFDHAIRMGRLRKLERLGLATKVGRAHWRLAPNLADTLRRMGERGDIIRTMQRAYTERGTADRKSVVEGKSVSVRVDLGGRRIINKKKHNKKNAQRQSDN